MLANVYQPPTPSLVPELCFDVVSRHFVDCTHAVEKLKMPPPMQELLGLTSPSDLPLLVQNRRSCLTWVRSPCQRLLDPLLYVERRYCCSELGPC